MPRSRDSATSCAARRAAKYRFQGTVVSMTSHDSAMITAPAVSSVVSGTRTTWSSQTISSAAAAPVKTRNHPATSRLGFAPMPPIVPAGAATRMGRSTQTDQAGRRGQDPGLGPGRSRWPAVSAASLSRVIS